MATTIAIDAGRYTGFGVRIDGSTLSNVTAFASVATTSTRRRSLTRSVR
jgi:hypothetical protein